MSLTNPSNIPAVNVWNVNAAQSIQYKGHTAGGVTDNNKFYYQTYDLDDPLDRRWVYYDITDDKWKDYGSATPDSISVNTNTSGNTNTVVVAGDTVRFWHNTDIRVTFTHPSWLNSSGGGSGPGTLSNSGSLQKSGSDLVWTISSVSQDGDYPITESSDGGLTFVVKTTITIPNLAGTRTGNVLNWNETYMYKFYDPLENLLGSYSPGTKKVFCNFW